jgi:hypothetical protein
LDVAEFVASDIRGLRDHTTPNSQLREASSLLVKERTPPCGLTGHGREKPLIGRDCECFGDFISPSVIMKSFCKSQIRQHTLYHYLHEQYVDGFARELTFSKRPDQHFL